MEKKDLMIGDWVTFKDCQHENPMPIKIIAIGFQADEEDDCLVQINGDKACDIITIDDEIVGIPLTAEILKKNGFIYKKLKGIGDNVIWRIEDDYYDIDIYEWSDSIWVFRYDCTEMSLPHMQATMSYVHELQHTLRLCGIEKEIEI